MGNCHDIPASITNEADSAQRSSGWRTDTTGHLGEVLARDDAESRSQDLKQEAHGGGQEKDLRRPPVDCYGNTRLCFERKVGSPREADSPRMLPPVRHQHGVRSGLARASARSFLEVRFQIPWIEVGEAHEPPRSHVTPQHGP